MLKNKKILLGVGISLCVVVIAVICFFAFFGKEMPTYTVTFDSDGGTVISETVVEEGMAVAKPTDPTKDGYLFVEWLLDGKSYDFSKGVNQNITLTALWQENIPEKELVTVKFYSDGGTTIANVIVEKGTKIERPATPIKEGYNFVDWFLGENVFDFNTEIIEDLELVAKWDKINVATNNNNSGGSNKNNNNNNSGSNS